MIETTDLIGAPGGAVRAAWDQAKDADPKLRARDAAELLGVPEASLVASLVGENATRLAGDFGALLARMPAVGEVMVLTRNVSCVHEKVGAFDHVDISPEGGVVLNHDIDLRVFVKHWQHGYALEEQLKDGAVRRSLQFFDGEGVAVHKIYAREATDLDAWAAIVDEWRAADQSDSFAAVAYPPKAGDRPDADIDVAALRTRWAAMQDVHEFFGMLRDLGVGRRQAFRLVGETHAREVAADGVRSLLEAAAAREVPIMVFVGNRGCIQIHTGPVARIAVMGPWLNVLDPGFNLHLRADHVATAHVVRKPTRDGTVTSLELFDAAGETIAMLFGERKPGQDEREDWRALIAEVEAA